MIKKPFIATRELVVFPGIVTPIFVGRDSSLASLDESLSKYDNKLVYKIQSDYMNYYNRALLRLLA